MATTAQCIYCFETLAATLEDRPALSLREIEELWARYDNDADPENSVQHSPHADSTLHPHRIAKMQGTDSPSSSVTPSTTSSSSALNNASTPSSKTSLFSSEDRSSETKEESHPVYVTWNTISARGKKHLRGCIGTFSPMPLSEGLREYSLVSALQDHRFHPITLRELPSLSNTITLLQNFTPCADSMDWQLGKHGLRMHFNYKGRRYGGTYLPDVAVEQGWDKEETLVSLMRKAGWDGKEKDWKKVELSCQRYEGMRADADYEDYKLFRDWLKTEGLP